jgi:hypothetical protein
MSRDPSVMGSIITMTLLRISSCFMKQTRLSPFEVLYGWMPIPPPLIKGIWGALKEIEDLTLRQQMQAFRLTLKNQ